MAQDDGYSTFARAADSGPYDERPTLADTLDLQLTLSKNERRQPFHLICEHDTVIVAMSGRGRVEFQGSAVQHYDYRVGEVIYVPAGTPHRIVPSTESIHHRFKLPESELEGVAWFCEGCGEELHREVWRLAERLPQEGTLHACTAFNADPALRSCSQCAALHPEIDLRGFQWEAIAREQRALQRRSR